MEYTPGSYQLKNLAIINYDRGTVLDIQQLAVELNVFESIFSPCMTASLLINDATNLIENLPIIGEELIFVEFVTPQIPGRENTDVRRLFFVDRLEQRTGYTQRAEGYLLHLSAVEMIVDYARDVDRAWVGKTIQQIVEDVYDQFLDPKEWTQNLPILPNGEQISTERKKLEVGKTLGAHSIVAPRSSPFVFLKYLMKQAQSEQYTESDFLFWETREQFNFKTVSELIVTQQPVESYYEQQEANRVNIQNDGGPQQYQTIVARSNATQFDVFQQLTKGMFGAELEVVDPVTKTYAQKLNYYYEDLVNKRLYNNIEPGGVVTTDKNPLNPVAPNINKPKFKPPHRRLIFDQFGEGGVEYRDRSYLRTRAYPDTGSGTYYVADPVGSFPFRRYLYMNLRISKFAQLRNVVMNLTIHGDTLVKAGDLINVFVPQNNEENTAEYNSLYYDGQNSKFLVTTVRHVINFNQQSFMTIMEVVKDSYAAEPTEKSERIFGRRNPFA